MSPVFPNSIEVFDLAENQDMLSPVELDPEKLAHKFKEVRAGWIISANFSGRSGSRILFLLKAPDQTRGDPGGDPAAEEEGGTTGFASVSPMKRCFPRMLMAQN